MTPEILAPVGGQQQLIAAVRAGADAVYLGTKGFNARQNAENFSADTLRDAVAYCHGRGVRVHVTVNTMVIDAELGDLEHEAEMIAASGADAVIIQDLAVLRLFEGRCPTIERHASTQMAIHNVEGAKMARDVGFSRVVLARELSLKELEIISNSVDIELEVFIHGALCVCVSGACYMSSVIGERSGNRGLCAQPCRTDFKYDGRNFVLSLKDLAAENHLRRLADAGVSSFKIEGRMKRPEYVAAAVDACVKARDGEAFDTEALKAVFSRSGFTDGHLTGIRNASMFGVRTQEDVEASKGILGSISELYRRERQSVPVRMALTLRQNSPAVLRVTDGKFSAEVSGPVPEDALSRPADLEFAEKCLMKTGGTPFYPEKIDAEIDPGISLPAAAINAMRRQALETLLEQKSRVFPHDFASGQCFAGFEKHRFGGKPVMWARFQTLEQVCDTAQFEKIILPIDCLSSLDKLPEAYECKLVAELLPVAFPDDEDSQEQALLRLKALGMTSIYTENLYGAGLGRRLGLEVYGGAGLNAANTAALEALKNIGVSAVTISFELMLAKIKALGGELPRGIIGYGRLPLMKIRACPAKDKNGCGNCTGRPVITDRLGVAFPLICTQRRFVTVLNSLPLYIGDRDLSGLDYVLLYFTIEPKEDCARIANTFASGEEFEGKKTSGLYFRALK